MANLYIIRILRFLQLHNNSCDVSSFQNKNYSEVLVSSDVRPSNNLTFCNVYARERSSLCDRVRLNFCALCDIKIEALSGSRMGQKMSYCSSFG